MTYDLVIRGGTVVDGSGLPRYRADVAVAGGRIARIGRAIRDAGREEIDARGAVVAPGFIDGHTHMDAQVAWDPLGTCSCWHGVTTVVMGNCGFTLAPCRPDERHLVLKNLERAEDIPAEAMKAGIDWTWETYAQYLDAVERWPKGINYAGYVGHSALRTYAMGERAFSEPATAEDLARMKRELADALAAGAMGFTTSRTRNHETADRQPVASRVATWDEVRQLVGVMGDLGGGIFEIAGEDTGRDPDRARDYLDRLRDLAVETGVPITWGMFSMRAAPDMWRPYFELLDETARAGGRMFAQVHSRALCVVLSFETRLPFDRLPEWRELRRRPLDEQRAALRDPGLAQKLVAAANQAEYGRGVGADTRRPDYQWIFLMEDPTGPHRSVAEIARERGVDPVAAMIELAVERDLRAFFVQPLANENQDHVLEMMRHPRSVVTFSDSGAHVSQIMDSSLQTHVLAYWVRRRQALTLEEGVRMLTLEPATAWGLQDRGLLREGLAADVVVFDPDRVAAEMPEVVNDLPAGARRLRQKAVGFRASVVNGQIVLRDGEPTGAHAGRLLRGPLARTSFANTLDDTPTAR
jgi:N-acyl-D-aspartate/D-glutamate deacylase